MFIGHFGVGFAAKRVAPRVSLGTAFLAAQFLDLLFNCGADARRYMKADWS